MRPRRDVFDVDRDSPHDQPSAVGIEALVEFQTRDQGEPGAVRGALRLHQE